MRKINVLNNNNRCMLRFTYLGQRHSITLGDYSNRADKAYAEKLANTIYLDCLANNFDSTLERYQPKGRQAAGIPIADLLQARLEKRYNDADSALLSHLNQWGKPIETLEQAVAFIEYLQSKVKLSSSTRYLNTLRAIRPELFKAAVDKLNLKTDRGVSSDAPFTDDEVRLIRGYFQEFDRHYYPLVSFLFLTGCRTSEALGIRKCDISLDRNEIFISESLGRSNGKSYKRERKGTKTGKSRLVPLSAELRKILSDRLDECSSDDLLFVSPNGLPIDDRNFSQRNWRKALERTGIPHRRLYNTRHTFISHCIDKRLNPVDIATITGHDVETLYKHYARQINKVELPELY